MANTKKNTVAVIYNDSGEDFYEKIKDVDPDSLGFKPEYNINVATVTEEYEAIANALREEGYEVKLVNINEDIQVLINLLKKNPPDVVFNLIEFYRNDPALEHLVAGLYSLYGVPIHRSGTFHACTLPAQRNDKTTTKGKQRSHSQI